MGFNVVDVWEPNDFGMLTGDYRLTVEWQEWLVHKRRSRCRCIPLFTRSLQVEMCAFFVIREYHGFEGALKVRIELSQQLWQWTSSYRGGGLLCEDIAGLPSMIFTCMLHKRGVCCLQQRYCSGELSPGYMREIPRNAACISRTPCWTVHNDSAWTLGGPGTGLKLRNVRWSYGSKGHRLEYKREHGGKHPPTHIIMHLINTLVLLSVAVCISASCADCPHTVNGDNVSSKCIARVGGYTVCRWDLCFAVLRRAF